MRLDNTSGKHILQKNTCTILDRRIGDMETLASEAKAWEKKRNEQKIMIQWRFTTNDAREKLKRHYEAVRN